MNNPVLLFDGVCNLCSGVVQFVLKHESEPGILFGTLQSEVAQRYIEKFHIEPGDMSSVIFIDNNVVYLKSEAAFKIAGYLKTPWSWVRLFGLLPRSVSDFFYDLIAKSRYRIFGKSEICFVPSAEYESRFLT
jgi:predicted DCC family thiol-disulfide oxidoreductase YuxK